MFNWQVGMVPVTEAETRVWPYEPVHQLSQYVEWTLM